MYINSFVEYYKKAHREGLSTVYILFWTLVYKLTRNRTGFYRRMAAKIAFSKYNIKFPDKSRVEEVFLDKEYTMYKDFLPNTKDIVIDIGAQFGDYAILCAAYYKAKVVTFEPLRSNFKLIKEAIYLNNLSSKEINAYNLGLGDRNRVITTNFNGDMINSMKAGKKVKMSVRTLDYFNFSPTIIKIDVEGYELQVLNGAKNTLRKYHPKIIIETHGRRLKSEVLKFLSKYRYKIKHYGNSKEDCGKFDFVQVIFLN